MRLRFAWIVLALLLAACNITVNSLTASPVPPAESNTPTLTPYADTPAPPAIQAPEVDSPPLVEIHFFNELDGWAVTETKIVRTNDGGITWYDVTPPDVEETGYSVNTFFLDQSHAWVQKPDFNNFPNNGLLYHTADGGLHWTISSTPFSGGDLNFLDPGNGWMLADLGVGAGSNAVAVFQTTDGGASWAQTYSNDPDNPESSDSLPLGGIKSDLVPRDMRTGWVTGVIYSSGTVYLYRTDDGGRRWSPVSLELPAGAENAELGIDRDQMQFTSATDGFLVVRMASDSTQTAVYITNDGGDSWRLTPTIIPGAGATDFLSPQEMILYNGEQFYVTRDSGTTWATVSPDIVFGDSFATMDFVNPNSGWVITADPSNHRSFYRTHNGGGTWLPVSP